MRWPESWLIDFVNRHKLKDEVLINVLDACGICIDEHTKGTIVATSHMPIIEWPCVDGVEEKAHTDYKVGDSTARTQAIMRAARWLVFKTLKLATQDEAEEILSEYDGDELELAWGREHWHGF